MDACKLLRILASNLKIAQRKIAHAYLYYSDFDVNGSYTYQELMQVRSLRGIQHPCCDKQPVSSIVRIL